MRNDKLFFLFTCVKNGRSYIETLFSSLLRQTKINFIHYIYDDGSDYPVDDLVETYRKKSEMLDNPIEIIYEKNSCNIGLNMATNHCIQMCNLPYFIWIDCDNWVDSHFFEELEKTAIKNPNAIMIRSFLYTVYENGEMFSEFNNKKIRYFAKKKDQSKNFFMNCCPFGFSFFAVKSSFFIDNYLMLDWKWFSNDHQIISQCIYKGLPIVWSRKAIGYFLCRDNSEGHDNLKVTKGTFKLREGYLEIAKQRFDYYLPKLRAIFASTELYRYSVSLIDNGLYNQALQIIFFKRKLNKKNKLSHKYYCKKYNDFIWIIKCLCFRIIRRPKRNKEKTSDIH